MLVLIFILLMFEIKIRNLYFLYIERVERCLTVQFQAGEMGDRMFID